MLIHGNETARFPASVCSYPALSDCAMSRVPYADWPRCSYRESPGAQEPAGLARPGGSPNPVATLPMTIRDARAMITLYLTAGPSTGRPHGGMRTFCYRIERVIDHPDDQALSASLEWPQARERVQRDHRRRKGSQSRIARPRTAAWSGFRCRHAYMALTRAGKPSKISMRR
jgi:hypothetical protein